MKLNVYLCGPITNHGDATAKWWREDITPLLVEAGHHVIDPLRRDYRKMERLFDRAQSIVNGDLDDLKAADLLIRLYGASEGSAQETFYFAKVLKRPVILVAPPHRPPAHESPWLWVHCHKWVTSIEEAVDSAVSVFHDYHKGIKS